MAKKRPIWPPSHVTYEFVTTLRDGIKAQNRKMYEDMHSAERAYDGDIDLGIVLPAGAPSHIPSRAMAKCDGAAAHIISDFPRVDIRTPGVGSRAVKRQELLREACTYALEQLTATSEENVWSEAKFDLVLLGSACIKVVFDEDSWPDPPERGASDADLEEWRKERRSAWPFDTFTVHPGSVQVSPDRSWPHKFVIETQKRTAVDMWTRYPHWRDPQAKDKNPAREIQWVEYWDDINYIAWGDGVEVFRKSNTHKCPPYIWVGVTRGRRGLGAKGILGGAVMSQVRAEARLMTLLDLLWQLDVFPRLLANKDEASSLQDSWNTGPGGILPVERVAGDDKSVEWLDMPQLNAAMFQFLPMVQQSIEDATYNPALMGDRPTGVDYGVHQAMLIGQARQALHPFVSALNRLGSMWVNMILRYMDTILDESIQLPSGARLDNSDIDGFYQARVVFEAVSQEEDDRRVSLGLQVLNAEAESHRTVLSKYFKHENPSSELAQWGAEKVVRQLLETGEVARIAMESAGMEIAEEEIAGETKKAALNLRKRAVGELGNRLQPGQGPTLGTLRGETTEGAGA